MKSIQHYGFMGVMCLVCSFLLFQTGTAQIKSQGPYCGKVYRSNASNHGIAYWVNASGAQCDEDVNRTATDPLRSGQHTQYLQISGFDFDIPHNAKVAGIEVVVIRRSNHQNSLRDRSVRLLRASEAIGQNKGSNEIWDTEWTAAYYGAENELWGRNWNADEVNDPEFGIVIDAQYARDEGQPQIDEVLITVHYYPSTAVPATTVAGHDSRFTCKRIGSFP